jgi:solute carrier family 25 (mitochondrial folate transporter), member 32
MSHERSTPPPTRTEGYAPTTSASAQYAQSHAAFTRQHVPLTGLESFCVGRSDSAFNALAGAAGGFASGVVTCPLDVIKTKLQAQGGFRLQHGASQSHTNDVYRGMLGTARIIWREEGLRGMYRGLGPIILGYLPTWAVWFTVYGKSKEFFFHYHGMLLESTFSDMRCG